MFDNIGIALVQLIGFIGVFGFFIFQLFLENKEVYNPNKNASINKNNVNTKVNSIKNPFFRRKTKPVEEKITQKKGWFK